MQEDSEIGSSDDEITSDDEINRIAPSGSQSLIPKLYKIRVHFKGDSATIIVENQNGENYRWLVLAIAAPLVGVKVFSSVGFRIYAMVDYFYNENYILYKPVVSHVPTWLSAWLTIYSVSADAHMNWSTRGVSTKRMVSDWLHRDAALELEQIPDTWPIFIARALVRICGVSSLLCSSLATFLGMVTISEYVTDDEFILVAVGIFCAIANFATNLSYRFKTAEDNLFFLMEKKLRWPTRFEWFVILISFAGVIPSYDYGTSHSIRKFLALLGVYQGDPDERVALDPKYESLIYTITTATLVPSALIYLLSQCCKMLVESKGIAEAASDRFTVRTRDVIRNYYRHLRGAGSPYRLSPPDVTYPALLQIFAVWLSYFFVPGEMIGNGLLTLNGCTGLIFRLITQDPWIVGLSSVMLALTSSIIYWHFNIPDWLDNSKEMVIQKIIHALKELLSKGERVPANLSDWVDAWKGILVSNESQNQEQNGIQDQDSTEEDGASLSTSWGTLFSSCGSTETPYRSVDGGYTDYCCV